MKKRIFSRLMAMFMAVALLSTTAFAYVAIDGNYINELNKNPQTDANGNQFVSVPQGDDGDNEYRLVDNVETDYTLKFSGDREVTLDLNGHTIDHQNKAGSVIWVDDGAKLTLEDSSGKENGEYVNAGEGKITGGEKRGGVLIENSEFIMKGGNITGNASWNGGGVTLYNSTFTMEGGNIEDNHYYPGGNGAGGIFGYKDSTLIINGGSIKNNKGNYGPWNASAILIEDGGSLTINGGLISGNTGGDVCIGIYTGSVNPGNNTPASTAIVTGGRVIDNEGSYSMIGVNQSDVSMQWTFNGNKYIACGNGDGDHPEHTFSEATCTEDSACTYCGKAGTQKATGHTYAPATCTEPATCHCGATEGEALGHSWNGGEVTTAPQPGVPGVRTFTCTVCGETRTEEIDALPMPIDFVDGFPGGDTGTTITDEEAPLAGIVTEAQLLDELYKHEGSPAVEIVEKYASHEYAPAISWALANAIVVDDEDFDPDEAVTVALLREVLESYVAFKGIDFTVVLTGEDDELVLDLSERLNMFFAELEK